MMESTTPSDVTDVTADDNGDASVISRLKKTRKELEPFGKTHILDVPGYEGLLGIEYQYISSEVTEKLVRDLRRELKNTNMQGLTLLSSIDTLIHASKRVLIRDSNKDDWRGIKGATPVKLGLDVAQILSYAAGDDREAVLGLFGSEHAIIQQNIVLSRWLANVKRTDDEDFLD